MSPSTSVSRPDLLGLAKKRLSFVERLTLRIVRASFEKGLGARLLPWLQRGPGQSWIHHATKRLLTVRGLERTLALMEPKEPGAPRPSLLLVTNHRSFFDLYVITAQFVRAGLQNRIVFPVRSNFFYDSLLGLFVNFWMSFFSMYPPLFRERKKAGLNVACLDELAWLMAQGGVFVGMHPEGTRNRGSDPYALLPAHSGVGRLVHTSRVQVVPAFVNGLGNDLPKQVWGNVTGRGERIFVLFGQPIDFSDLLAAPASPQVFRAIAERCMQEIARLGAEERQLRAESTAHRN